MGIEEKKKEIQKIKEQQFQYRDAYLKYQDLQNQINSVEYECRTECEKLGHPNAYWESQSNMGWLYGGGDDDYFDLIVCPDCGAVFDERCEGKKHTRQSRRDYIQTTPLYLELKKKREEGKDFSITTLSMENVEEVGIVLREMGYRVPEVHKEKAKMGKRAKVDSYMHKVGCKYDFRCNWRICCDRTIYLESFLKLQVGCGV